MIGWAQSPVLVCHHLTAIQEGSRLRKSAKCSGLPLRLGVAKDFWGRETLSETWWGRGEKEDKKKDFYSLKWVDFLLHRKTTKERKASIVESEDQGSTPCSVAHYVASDKGFNLVIPRIYSFICPMGIQILHLMRVVRLKWDHSMFTA